PTTTVVLPPSAIPTPSESGTATEERAQSLAVAETNSTARRKESGLSLDGGGDALADDEEGFAPFSEMLMPVAPGGGDGVQAGLQVAGQHFANAEADLEGWLSGTGTYSLLFAGAIGAVAL